MSIARIIYGSTASESSYYNPDLRWKISMRLFDPHFFIEFSGPRKKGVLIASSLELRRARREARNAVVVSVDELRRRTSKQKTEHSVVSLLRSRGVRRVVVHPDTPASVFRFFAKRFSAAVGRAPWYEERVQKTPSELSHIRGAVRIAEAALRRIRDRILRARVFKGVLTENGRPLTSEILRTETEKFFFENGFLGHYTIIACGRDSADPHTEGRGPLRERMPIVCDLFPYSQASGYYADITRTFFKREPPDEITHAYEAVRRANELGISLVHSGIEGDAIHRAVTRTLEEAGFRTRPERGEGFIHITGHGVGLECHELPHIGLGKSRIPTGSVVTVEPGLYYPAAGFGIRIEDMVVARPRAAQVLTTFPKDLSRMILS